ncbi:hypothetical protein LTR36_010875 [Oleoguttula mirabilis]|uniref:Uncharacterized protein n=1 Tax=Oleoguttula mirabilis TaxID=1507867 RepID=A0AAV9J4M0_9PEZI|nr:hypothetical protein LTR36_010875 [Oleoguttula mirabilis]
MTRVAAPRPTSKKKKKTPQDQARLQPRKKRKINRDDISSAASDSDGMEVDGAPYNLPDSAKVDRDGPTRRKTVTDTFIGPIAVDERTKIAIGHLIVDGSTHVFYPNHVRAIVAACGSITHSGEQLQRVCELMHAQARDLGMSQNAGMVESDLRKVMARQLAAEVDDADTLAAVVAMLMHTRAAQGGEPLSITDLCHKLEAGLTGSNDFPQQGDHAAPARSQKDILSRAAKALDTLWDEPSLRNMPPEAARDILNSCIATPQDLHVAHVMADNEVNAYYSQSLFDLGGAYEDAGQAWKALSDADRLQWTNSHAGLLDGNLNMLREQSNDMIRAALKGHFQQQRTPLSKPSIPTGSQQAPKISFGVPTTIPTYRSANNFDQASSAAVGAGTSAARNTPNTGAYRQPLHSFAQPGVQDTVLVKREVDSSPAKQPTPPPAAGSSAQKQLDNQILPSIVQPLNIPNGDPLASKQQYLSLRDTAQPLNALKGESVASKQQTQPLRGIAPPLNILNTDLDTSSRLDLERCVTFMKYGYRRVEKQGMTRVVHLKNHQFAREACKATSKLGKRSFRPRLFRSDPPGAPWTQQVFVATAGSAVDVGSIITALAQVSQTRFCLQHADDHLTFVVTFDRAVRARQFDVKILRLGKAYIIRFKASQLHPCKSCRTKHANAVGCAQLFVATPPGPGIALYLVAPPAVD